MHVNIAACRASNLLQEARTIMITKEHDAL